MKNLTPLKAIRKRCLDCSGFSSKEVADCQEKECSLWEYRFGKRPKGKARLTPIRAIRKYCLWCVCDSSAEVRLCPSEDCPLWNYRLGKNPRRKGVGGNPRIGQESKKSVVELEKNKGSEIGNGKLLT